MGRLNKKRLLVVVGILIGVSAVAGLGFALTNSDSEQEELFVTAKPLIDDGPCSSREIGSILADSISPFLADAYGTTDEEKSERTKKLVDLETRITKQENYTQDANCLHILTMIYIDRPDPQLAELHLSLLESGLDASNPESYILDENVNYKSLKLMRSSIETLLTTQQQTVQPESSEDVAAEAEPAQ